MSRNSLFETHLVTKATDQGEWPDGGGRKIEKRFGCGRSTTTGIYKEVIGDAEPSCPGCSSAWGKRKLKDRPDLRLERVELDGRSQFRSMYEAFVSDALIGFISLEHGWGKQWTISHVGFFDGKPMRGEAAIKDLYSKEAALLRAAEANASGKLKSADQVQREREQRIAQIQRDRAKREADEKAKADERAFMLETLAGMLASDPPLTNARREAVVYAIGRIAKSQGEADRLLGPGVALVTDD